MHGDVHEQLALALRPAREAGEPLGAAEELLHHRGVEEDDRQPQRLEPQLELPAAAGRPGHRRRLSDRSRPGR